MVAQPLVPSLLMLSLHDLVESPRHQSQTMTLQLHRWHQVPKIWQQQQLRRRRLSSPWHWRSHQLPPVPQRPFLTGLSRSSAALSRRATARWVRPFVFGLRSCTLSALMRAARRTTTTTASHPHIPEDAILDIASLT